MATENTADHDPRVEEMNPSRRRLSVPALGPIVGSLASASFAQVALVVTGIITARALGPADRGYLALVILVPTVLHGIGALGVPRAVTYFIASDPAREASVLRAIRGIVLVQALVLTVLQVAIMAALLADDPSQVKWAGVAVLPLLAANLVDMYGKSILQGQKRYAAFNVLRNAALGFYLVGVVLLVLVGETDLIAFTIAYVVACALSAIVTLAVALAGRPWKSEAASFPRHELVRFGLRGYLASMTPGTLRLDQTLVGVVLAPQALGLYVVGLAFTNLPTFISRSIGFIAFPQVAGATTGRLDEVRRFLWFSIALSGAAVLVLELTAGWLVPFFFGSEFEGAVVLTRILLIGAFFEGARHILNNTTSGLGRPGLGSIAEVSSWMVLIPAIAILLPAWDAKGVAAATTIASATSFVVLVLLVRFARDASPRRPALHGHQT